MASAFAVGGLPNPQDPGLRGFMQGLLFSPKNISKEQICCDLIVCGDFIDLYPGDPFEYVFFSQNSFFHTF